MGDPGLPIMAGVLAVPVGVLLFVLVLAMMGRRWAFAGPDEALVAEYDAGYEDDDLELEPAPSHRPAYDPYGSSYAEPAPYGEPARDPYRSAAQETYAEPRDPYDTPSRDPYGTRASDPYASPVREPYSTPTREPYSSPAHEPYAAPRSGSSGVSDWEPYVPAPRRSSERPSWSEYGPAADSYGGGSSRSAADPYGSSQDSYGSSQDPYGSARDSYGSPAAYDAYDAYDRGTYDDPPAYRRPRHAPPEDPEGGFPYGPYGSR
ncbi:hypothetical protein GCM10023196_084540 [Actinoallomurus vinaceus]|uniref:Uncharacterized protein n=1 Tax=Actinoallomurus vinaceus TaxID=1080074 RepID=A0ABP8UN24_9ACTN